MNVVELKNISKSFGNSLANDSIDLAVKRGEIHCLLGENGAGKTTLMKILFGLYSRDQGSILINGEEVEIKSPRQAIELGLGMIHQHFMLVGRLTVTENIIAGREPRRGILIDYAEGMRQVKELTATYQLSVNPGARVEDISIGEQQRVEILKALYRQAEILILDEPTAVLTPQETGELFAVLKKLKESGKTIIFITHKLKETMAISDRVTILRDGKKVATIATSATSPTELARLMVGREVILRVKKAAAMVGKTVLQADHLTYYHKKNNRQLEQLSFVIKAGEILGVAGVEGNGQQELEELLTGLSRNSQGKIFFKGKDISSWSTRERRYAGIGHIPSDRLKRGLIADFNLEKNLILGSEWQQPYARKGFLDYKVIRENSKVIIERFRIKTSGSQALVRDLSGGNQQKVIIGRELRREPELIVAAQPTRGVDVGAIEYIHKLLLKMREEGKGVLLISAELDELLSLSDRLIVLYEGRIVASGNTVDFTEAELGLLMAGQGRGGVKNGPTE